MFYYRAILLSSLFFFGCTFVAAQTENEIVEEGKRLYKISLALTHGEEIVKTKYPAIHGSSTSHVVYVNNGKAVCVYFSSDEPLKVVLSVSFDSQARVETANIDSKVRDGSLLEKELLALSNAMNTDLTSNTFYKNYGGTTLSVIPISDVKGKRAYVLTNSEKEGVVTFGNDYLVNFGNDNKIVKRTVIHRNLMWTETDASKANTNAVEAWHTHTPETGSLISSTDIYNLLMYEKSTTWKKYSVISETTVSVWSCDTDKLSLINRQTWDQESKQSLKK